MEVILAGSGEPSANSFISVADLQTGSHLITFKQSSSSKNAVTCVGNTLAVAQNDKATINIYKWHKEAIDQKIIVPEKLETLCSSHDGTWILGGSATGKIYLWEVASGNLLFVRDAHYQAVTVCMFSEDDLSFVTGSADTTIQVWRLAEILDPYANQDLVRPNMNLTRHNLAITDLHIGTGSTFSARLYTCSMDQTIRIWDLATGDLITTLLLPTAITSMMVDSGERVIFAGTESGLIHEVRLYKQDKVVRMIGGMGTIVNSGQMDEATFVGHESGITALALSLDGSLLTSGAEDGNVFVWDVATRQMIRKLKQQPSAITILQACVRPASETVITQKNQNTQLQPFKRTQNERDRDEHNIFCKLGVTSNPTSFQPMSDDEAAHIGLGQITGPSTDPAAQETITKLQDELRKLYGNYSELRVKHEELNKTFIASQV